MSRKDIAIDGKETQFNSFNQPLSERKKQGWQYKQNLKKYQQFYLNKSVSELENIKTDIKNHPEKYKMVQIVALDSVDKMDKDFRYFKDHRDRAEGLPKQNILVDGESQITLNIIKKIVHGKDS